MSTGLERYISAATYDEFNRMLAGFALEGYGKLGIGVVVLTGDIIVQPDGSIEAHLEYVPYEAGSPRIPSEATRMLDAYDPAREFVLVVIGKGNSPVCFQKAIAGPAMLPDRHVAFPTGTVLKLKSAIDGIAPGLYVLRGVRGAFMQISPLVLDDDEGEMDADDQVLTVHGDFSERFERTGAVINPRWI